MSQFLPLENLEAYVKSLKSIPYLHSFGTEHVDEMFKASLLSEYDEGEVIIEEGGLDRQIYFLLLGEVAVLKDGQEVARIKDYGEIFGELAILDNTVRSATVVAATPCYCLLLASVFIESLNPHEQLACYAALHRICAHVLAERLKKTNSEVVELEKELAALKG